MWGKDKVRAADFVFLGEDRAPILQCLGVIPTQSELPSYHTSPRAPLLRLTQQTRTLYVL